MPLYNYQCLYCGNCDLRLSGLDDHMTLCSQCGNLMLRLEDDFFWQCFDKSYFHFSTKKNSPPVSTTGINTNGGKISMRLNSGQCRFALLNKWTRRANISAWRESHLPMDCRAKIFYDKKLMREPDSLT